MSIKKQFFENNKTIEFIVTDDDNSLIVVTNELGQVTLLTQYYDFDMDYLIKFYKECCDSIEDMMVLFR